MAGDTAREVAADADCELRAHQEEAAVSMIPPMSQRERKALRQQHRVEMLSGHRFMRLDGDVYQCRRCWELFAGPVVRTALALVHCVPRPDLAPAAQRRKGERP